MSLLTNLVHYWKLDETGTGNAADSVGSINMNNTNSVTYASGKINNGVPLVAASSQSMITASAPNIAWGSSAWSISVWAILNSVADANRGIIGNRFSGSPAGWFTLGTGGGGVLEVERGVSSSDSFKPAGQGWQHYVVTRTSGGLVSLYRNDVARGSSSADGANGANTQLVKLGHCTR